MAFDFGGLVGDALSLGGNILGAKSSADAAKDAIKTQQHFVQKGIDESGTYYDTAKSTLDKLAQIGAGAPEATRGVAFRPANYLTPAQRQQIDDVRRNTINNLAISGLRGAGRAGQAVLNDAVNRTMQGFYDRNQARADDARKQLYGTYSTSQTGQANLASNRGSQILSARSNEGYQAAPIIQGAGDTIGQAFISGGNLLSDSVGRILGQIAGSSAA